MNRKLVLKAAVAAAACLTWSNAWAYYTVYVTGSRPFEVWTQSWATAQTSLMTTLNNIGAAINSNAQQVTTAIQQNGDAQRELALQQAYNDRLLEVRQRAAVPRSICSASASGGSAMASSGATRNLTSIESGGGGASITTLNDATNLLINGPAQPADITLATTAKAGSQFCTAEEVEQFGGGIVCPSANTEMPAGDRRIASVTLGAGPYGKDADRTFTQKQADVARLYVENSINPDVAGASLTQSQIDTPDGQMYVGLRTKMDAMMSAASAPANQAIAERMPVPETKDFIQDALESASAKSYWDATASEQALSTNTVSQHELDYFEVGRRYGNIAYIQDLQEMSGENLLREQIRMQALNAHLLLSVKDQLETLSIIEGQQLASVARNEYAPQMQAQLSRIYGER